MPDFFIRQRFFSANCLRTLAYMKVLQLHLLTYFPFKHPTHLHPYFGKRNPPPQSKQHLHKPHLTTYHTFTYIINVTRHHAKKRSVSHDSDLNGYLFTLFHSNTKGMPPSFETSSQSDIDMARAIFPIAPCGLHGAIGKIRPARRAIATRYARRYPCSRGFTPGY